MNHICSDSKCTLLPKADKTTRKCGCGKTLVVLCKYCNHTISSSNFSKHEASCKNKKRKMESKEEMKEEEEIVDESNIKKVNKNENNN